MSRPATYRAAVRLAKIVALLSDRPDGVALSEIELELGVSRRTLLRYLAALRVGLIDRFGSPRIFDFSAGGHRKLTLSSARLPPPDVVPPPIPGSWSFEATS